MEKKLLVVTLITAVVSSAIALFTALHVSLVGVKVEKPQELRLCNFMGLHEFIVESKCKVHLSDGNEITVQVLRN